MLAWSVMMAMIIRLDGNDISLSDQVDWNT
jgi:hypothetical protein